MTTHYISYSKWKLGQHTIRVQFAVPAMTRQEAKQIAAKEIAALRGYRFQGCD